MFSTTTHPDGGDTIILFVLITTKHLYNMLTTCMSRSICYKNHTNITIKLMRRCAPMKIWTPEMLSLSEMKSCLLKNLWYWSEIGPIVLSSSHSEFVKQLHQALKWFTSIISADKIAQHPERKPWSFNKTGRNLDVLMYVFCVQTDLNEFKSTFSRKASFKVATSIK